MAPTHHAAPPLSAGKISVSLQVEGIACHAIVTRQWASRPRVGLLHAYCMYGQPSAQLLAISGAMDGCRPTIFPLFFCFCLSLELLATSVI